MPAVDERVILHLSAQDEVFPSAHQPSQKRWFSRWHIILTFCVSLLICGWFVTWADGKFLVHDGLASFYDAQALSIMTGHFDVPREAIGFEAYIVNGKAYGYFGIAPALLRIPLLIVFPQFDGLWSRLMMMVACTLALLCAYRILLQMRGNSEKTTRFQRLLHSLFILCAALGSTNVFIIARSYIFHEAIIWGSTFALLFALTLLKYLQSPSRLLLAAAGAFAFMSFHSRATAGAGALLAMCLLTAILLWRALRKSDAAESSLAFRAFANPLAHALIAAVAVTFTLTTYFCVNYAKFRTFGSMPLQYYYLYVQTPSRMQATGAKQIHPENLPTSLATYFGLRGLQFEQQFPWVGLARNATVIGSPSIDVVEPFSTFPVSMPALTLLALAGGVLLVRGSSEAIRRARLPAITLLAGGGVVLMTVGITERYLHDLYPALIVCAAVGVYALESKKHIRLKTAVLSGLTIVSILLNCAFALVNQRAGPWGVPAAKQAEFIRFQQSIDQVLHRIPFSNK